MRNHLALLGLAKNIRHMPVRVKKADICNLYYSVVET